MSTQATTDLFDDLRWRGLLDQWTHGDALPALLRDDRITLYIGFDPSADSLHIGNLVGLTLLRRFQKAGHRPIALAGGATGMIGDPSGRSDERSLLDPDRLRANLEGIRPQMERLLDFESGQASAMLVDNSQWLAPWGFLDFLREVGKHFPVNVMLGRDLVRSRMEAGISYTEFSYVLLQAYDFVHLHDTYGCVLQAGGSDQWGNITAGVDLGRRMRGAQLYGLTHPLITRSDGQKFGKSAAGDNYWLDPQRTSPYAFYQFWLNADDADAGRYLRTFTELDREEILGLEGQAAERPQAREAQQRLAAEVTRLVHGDGGLERAQRATRALFGGELTGLGESDLLEVFAEVPSAQLPRARLGSLTAEEALVTSGLAASRSAARRLVDQGGASVGSRRLSAADEKLSAQDLSSPTVMVLRAGKRSYALLRFPH